MAKTAMNTRHALLDRAVTAHKEGQIVLARELYQELLQLQPEDATGWSNLGVLHRMQKDFSLSCACHRRALELAPDTPTILHNAANSFLDAGQAETALSLRRHMETLSPNHSNNKEMLGKALRALGRYKEALSYLDIAIATHPQENELKLQRALTLLSLGDYPQGFSAFQSRWEGDELTLPKVGLPQWNGEDIAGKTLLVLPEQGFGDTILFARFLQELKAMGATVWLGCKPPLVRLFKDLPGVDKLVLRDADIKGADIWSPMMDLPLHLGSTLDTLPPPTALHIPEDSRARARSLLKPSDNRFKLGVMWSGSVTYRANFKRSFNHRRFLRLADLPGLQMVSLYKGPLHEAYKGDGSNAVILDAGGSDRDFADAAAVIQELDLVITIDSAVAHVSGSLGAPVWNLLHSEAYWLYEPFEHHTPWYPSMRLIRQQNPNDWDGVFELLMKDLPALIKEKQS